MGISFINSVEGEEFCSLGFNLGLRHVRGTVVSPANDRLLMLPDRVNFKGLNGIMVWVAVLSFGNHMGLDIFRDDWFLLLLLL